jgi:hypothetical protein
MVPRTGPRRRRSSIRGDLGCALFVPSGRRWVSAALLICFPQASLEAVADRATIGGSNSDTWRRQATGEEGFWICSEGFRAEWAAEGDEVVADVDVAEFVAVADGFEADEALGVVRRLIGKLGRVHERRSLAHGLKTGGCFWRRAGKNAAQRKPSGVISAE